MQIALFGILSLNHQMPAAAMGIPEVVKGKDIKNEGYCLGGCNLRGYV